MSRRRGPNGMLLNMSIRKFIDYYIKSLITSLSKISISESTYTQKQCNSLVSVTNEDNSLNELDRDIFNKLMKKYSTSKPS